MTEAAVDYDFLLEAHGNVSAAIKGCINSLQYVRIMTEQRIISGLSTGLKRALRLRRIYSYVRTYVYMLYIKRELMCVRTKEENSLACLCGWTGRSGPAGSERTNGSKKAYVRTSTSRGIVDLEECFPPCTIGRGAEHRWAEI